MLFQLPQIMPTVMKNIVSLAFLSQQNFPQKDHKPLSSLTTYYLFTIRLSHCYFLASLLPHLLST